MTDDQFLAEAFRAQLVLYRHHYRQHDNDEAMDDIKRAERMASILYMRYPVALCRRYHEWFLQGVRAS